MLKTNRRIIFAVNAIHYSRRIHQRANGSFYVVHRGRSFTVEPMPSDVWRWTPWCDPNSLALAAFHRQLKAAKAIENIVLAGSP